MDATAWDQRYKASEQVWSLEPNRWVVQEMSGQPTGRALDLATGEGRNALWLAEQGWAVTGVDFSRVGLDRASMLADASASKRHQPLDVTWVCADITSLELPAAEYDLVLLSYVQIQDYERTPLVRASAAALAPGGVLLVIAHDSSNLTEGHGGPQDPAVLYTAADLEKDLQDQISAGALVVESSGRVARDVETPEGTAYAWDVLFKVRRRDPSKVEFTLG